MRVAFVGLGTMGLPMARHLVAAGHQLVGYDLDPSRVEALGVAASICIYTNTSVTVEEIGA